ncbi:hypothetical protein IMSHALPRED_001288 [Imshaugia aleurites]|uniref:Uncharacterized protein n=1 Tax=Imshaugia aleurites TaxID=172621 RepID=A0A8H3PFK6_9LECA|nr:hypothetical protein IMSHALPRED_001288 [Imshaugia aleurites]
MSFAAPGFKDGFWYDGDLYVEVGGLNRHKRAPIAEITAILRPDLKKSKTTTAQPSKDPVGHWYEAQLLHYGLPPSKDKARAKMPWRCLLQSADFEESLRKEFKAAEKKAKAQYKLQLEGEPKDTTKARKRKQPDSAPNVNVTVNFDGMGTTTEQQLHSPNKKSKAAPEKNSETEAAIVGTRAPQAASNKEASATKSPITKKPSAMTKTVASKQDKFGAKTEPAVKEESSMKKEPTMKKESLAKKVLTVKKSMMKNESMAKKATPLKKESAMKKEKTTERKSAVKAEKPHK